MWACSAGCPAATAVGRLHDAAARPDAAVDAAGDPRTRRRLTAAVASGHAVPADPDCPARPSSAASASQTCVSAWSQVVAGRAAQLRPARATATVRCWGLAESIRAGGAGGAAADGDAPGGGGAGPVGRRAPDLRRDPRAPGALLGQPGTGHLQRSGGPGQALPLTRGDGGGPGRGLRLRHQPAGRLVLGQQRLRPAGAAAGDAARASWRCRPRPGSSASWARASPAVVHDGADRLCAWGQNATKMVTTSDDRRRLHQPAVPAGRGRRSQLVVGDTHACLLHQAGTSPAGASATTGRWARAARTRPTSARRARPPGWRCRRGRWRRGSATPACCCEGGTVTCFGRNHLGQIGPLAMSMVEEEVRQPTSVTGFSGAGGRAWAAVPAPSTPARSSRSGGVQCWGANATGQLGDGVRTIDETRKSATPVTVTF